jgi:hypothetical protein
MNTPLRDTAAKYYRDSVYRPETAVSHTGLVVGGRSRRRRRQTSTRMIIAT